MRPLFLLRRRLGRVATPAAFFLALIPGALYAAPVAAELPVLQAGMWELRGVVDGRKVDGRKCANPSRDIEEETAVLERAGCRVSPIARSGNRYTYRADCEMKTRSGRVLTSNRTSELTVDGDKRFQLRVRGTTNGRPIAETVTGRRIGDCDK